MTYTPKSVTGSPHTIGAKYEGDGVSYQPSSGSGSVTVNQIQSSTFIGCAPSTVVVGSTSTCSANVGGYNPTGTVTFSQSGGSAKTSLTAPATCTLSSGTCQIIVSTTGAGGANLIGVYSGDTNNLVSSGATTLGVSAATSTTNVICAPASLVVGQQSTCTATVTGYSPTGIITWSSSDNRGVFSANPCTLASASCGIAYTPTASATITASYSGDPNNLASSGTFAITASVNEIVQIAVANSGPPATVTLSGCSVSPTAITANGTPQTFTASSGCSPITISLPAPGANSRYQTATGTSTLTIGSCASASCQTFSATIYFQVQNTYQASPKSPAAWSDPGSIVVSGTLLGSGGQTICTITVSTGSSQFSCQGYTDYNTQAIMGQLLVSTNQRWATASSSFSDTTAGNQHSSDYYSQVLEGFQYSLAGSTTAPSAPALSFTSFGAPNGSPLIGSTTTIWLDSGSGWSVPATLIGSTSNERWQSLVSSGAATASQTVSLTYYHQFMVDFAFTVSGGGTAYTPPSASFTAFGAPARGTQNWVDAGSSYNYTNPLAGTTSVERWFTSMPAGVILGAGTVSPVFYHQFSFVMSFSVSGAGVFNNPRLNYSTFGSPVVQQVNATQATFWVDSGTGWGVSQLLPSSSSVERWITKQTASGTASAPLQAQMQYYHQFLGTLHYSIKGQGGSPAVPRLNYTSLGAILQPLLNSSSTYWMDSGSTWGVPLILPGGQGERWLSNVTGATLVGGAFRVDSQYTHQFFVEAGPSTAEGGAVGTPNQWRDQGSSVILNQTSAKLWSFAYWRGATPFSYNGTAAMPTMIVTGAANETAIFFPGLHISTESQGAVGYKYGTISGVVPAGTNTTIYVPPGRNVTLTAIPNTVSILFEGWTGAQALSSSALKLQAWVSIYSPSVVHASFAIDYTDIRTFAIATLVVFIGAAYAFVVRRGFTPKIKQ